QPQKKPREFLRLKLGKYHPVNHLKLSGQKLSKTFRTGTS
ncbi:MAG: hypothetical protein ACI9W2_001357, partial [Gammaproteobacteria bacterium]